MFTRYRGYSSVERTTPATAAYNLDLVKRDLLNHFMTRLRSRVRRPRFGSIVWDLLMEPFDDTTEQIVRADSERIIRGDPRVSLQEMQVLLDPDNHSIVVRIKVTYVEFNMDEIFDVTFKEEI